MGLPNDDVHRQVFLDQVVSGNAAHLPLSPGIDLCVLQAGKARGLAVQIAREAQQAGQMQYMLERRLGQARVFDGYFIYLDARDALVVWHALPKQGEGTRQQLGDIVRRLLSLARLEALDPLR